MPAVSEPRKACKNSKKAWEKFSRPFGTHVAAAKGSPLNLVLQQSKMEMENPCYFESCMRQSTSWGTFHRFLTTASGSSLDCQVSSKVHPGCVDNYHFLLITLPHFFIYCKGVDFPVMQKMPKGTLLHPRIVYVVRGVKHVSSCLMLHPYEQDDEPTVTRIYIYISYTICSIIYIVYIVYNIVYIYYSFFNMTVNMIMCIYIYIHDGII